MRNEKMVTRTIETTRAFYTALEVDTAQVIKSEIVFTGHFDNDKALSMAKRALDSDNFKVVMISDIEYVEKLYGMPESEFIDNAVELDPITRKAI